MGNLFSSEDSRLQEEARIRTQELQRERHRQLLEANRQQWVRENQVRIRREEERRQMEYLNELMRRSSIRQSSRTQPVQIRFNIELITSFHRAFDLLDDIAIDVDQPYTLTELDEYSSKEYNKIHTIFRRTNKRTFTVDTISRVDNPFLQIQYNLKKEQLGSVAEERLFFHGTKEMHLDSILRNNFDISKVKNFKFGRGVSFARDSYYATHYSDKSYEKVIIVVKVLIGRKCLGNKITVVPPEPHDTTSNQDETVFVKYDDNSYYPAYVVRYSGWHTTENNRKQNGLLWEI